MKTRSEKILEIESQRTELAKQITPELEKLPEKDRKKLLKIVNKQKYTSINFLRYFLDLVRNKIIKKQKEIKKKIPSKKRR